MDISQKTVPITGTNRGIGRAHFEEALQRGAKRVYAVRHRIPSVKIRPSWYMKQIKVIPQPNSALNSDPAYIVFRSLSFPGFLGFVQRLGAGVAG